MVTVYHQTRNASTGKFELGYYFYLFGDKGFNFEMREFTSKTDARVWFKKVKLDCFLINFERMLSRFKLSEPTFEITNAIDRCRKFFEWTKARRNDYEALEKYAPMIMAFVALLIQAVSPEDFAEMQMYVFMMLNFKW